MSEKIIILDIGSGYCKVGFNGEKEPSVVVPSVVGYPKPNTEYKEIYVGKDALLNREILDLKYPIKRGVFSNWVDFEKLLNHIFKMELKVDPSNYKILFIEPSLFPKINREKITEIMFGSFNVEALFFSKSSALSVLAAGFESGLSIEFGYGTTQIAPVYKGHQISGSSKRLDLGGIDIDSYMAQLLNKQQGYSFSTFTNGELLMGIKEKLSFVSVNVSDQLKQPNKKSYETPDNQFISIDQECFLSTEILFNPSYADIESHGIHELALRAIKNCDIDIRGDINDNIILSGGTSLLPGIAERLTLELSKLSPHQPLNINIVTPQNRKHLCWIGGSMLVSSQSNFDQDWFTNENYKQSGKLGINTKFT